MAKLDPKLNSKLWQIVTTTQIKEIHCMPVDDILEHTKSTKCLCNPELIEVEGYDYPVYNHNSYDYRELWQYLEDKGIKI